MKLLFLVVFLVHLSLIKTSDDFFENIENSYNKISSKNHFKLYDADNIPTSHIALEQGVNNAGAAIGLTMYSSLGISDQQNKLIDILFNVDVIDIKINKNYENALKLKQVVSSLDPRADQAILVSETGFQCNVDFCSLAKVGLHSLGICSQFICECGKVEPSTYKCDTHKVYDPVYTVCDYPQFVKVCGIY